MPSVAAFPRRIPVQPPIAGAPAGAQETDLASLAELNRLGQSLWLDFIDRDLLVRGGLQRLVERGVTGVTTNPTIFHKAIAGSAAYDEAIRVQLAHNPKLSAAALTEALIVADVQAACDVLRSVYDHSAGHDGYVSIEVAPDLAFDTDATVEAARRLWRSVARPNLMVKVPGTAAGVVAVERLLGLGINVNVTLLFSVTRYETVVQAWARGVERCEDRRRLASVASFFVSRVDIKADKALDALGTPQAEALKGRIAVANARAAYARFRALLAEPRIRALLEAGVRPQRPLWASTGTKNRAYSDVLYVDALIGPDTVNTVPPDTLEAFLDHGQARATLHAEDAARDLEALRGLGVDLDAITRELEAEGVAAFQDSWNQLVAALGEKARALMPAAAG
jgi:transaldolase